MKQISGTIALLKLAKVAKKKKGKAEKQTEE